MKNQTKRAIFWIIGSAIVDFPVIFFIKNVLVGTAIMIIWTYLMYYLSRTIWKS